MSSLWDSFGQKIYSGSIQVNEIVELIEFLKEFDAKNNDIIVNLMRNQLNNIGVDMIFTNWDRFETYIKTGSVHRRVLEYFIGSLHDFDHANEQVLMYSFTQDKHYWVKHVMFRNWMGTFRNGKWTKSKQFKEIHERAGI